MGDKVGDKEGEATLPVVPYMAKEKDGHTGGAMAMFRFGMGYIMFSSSAGVAMAWWDSAGRGALSSVVWIVPVVALGGFVWLARRGRREYLIGFLVGVGTCGSLMSVCALNGM